MQSAFDSFMTMALYKSIYLLTYSKSALYLCNPLPVHHSHQVSCKSDLGQQRRNDLSKSWRMADWNLIDTAHLVNPSTPLTFGHRTANKSRKSTCKRYIYYSAAYVSTQYAQKCYTILEMANYCHEKTQTFPQQNCASQFCLDFAQRNSEM